jgi:RNA polymerase sigma-70 factor, ECF subfamily
MTPIAVPDEDARLMREFALGDARGFEQLYHQHKGGVYRYFLRSVSDTGLAEELAQDVWAALIRARATYQAEAKFTTWLYRLAHNRLIDHYRRANLVVFTALDRDDDDSEGMPMAEPVHPAPGPEDAAAHRAAAKRVVFLVEQLPPAQREALLMQLEGGLTLEEIAVATGQGFETIKSRLRYAFAKLREGLKDHV